MYACARPPSPSTYGRRSDWQWRPRENQFRCNPRVYNDAMRNRVTHVSDAEAASDFASLLDRIRAGDEVVIEHNAHPVAVLRPPPPGARSHER